MAIELHCCIQLFWERYFIVYSLYLWLNSFVLYNTRLSNGAQDKRKTTIFSSSFWRCWNVCAVQAITFKTIDEQQNATEQKLGISIELSFQKRIEDKKNIYKSRKCLQCVNWNVKRGESTLLPSFIHIRNYNGI